MTSNTTEDSTLDDLKDFLSKEIEKHFDVYLEGQEKLIIQILEFWEQHSMELLARYLEKKNKVVEIGTGRRYEQDK